MADLSTPWFSDGSEGLARSAVRAPAGHVGLAADGRRLPAS